MVVLGSRRASVDIARSRSGSTTDESHADGSMTTAEVVANEVIGGAKTIGLFGGVALLINNITGSAMVLFPSLYQQAGWFIVTFALLCVAFLSYLCTIFIIESMAAMPGNHKFEKRVEYTSLSYYYLGKYGYYITQFFFQLSLACNNISSIIQSVQVMDFAMVAMFKKSCAIPEFYPTFSFHCPDPIEHDITPFGDMYLLSIGFLITALVVLPLGFWNLDDNIVIQKCSCGIVVLLVVTWFGIFIEDGLVPSRVEAIGTNFSQVLGVVVFNFAIISSIPSWVNEKKEGVSILKTMGISISMALALFTITGVFGGLAYEPWFNTENSDETLLNKLQNSSSTIAKITFYVFPVVINLTSIPVFAIMQRYNLLEAKVCGPKMANFIGVVLPWLVCIPFYTGSGFSNIVNWGGIIFNSTVNFIIPPFIYIAMVRKQEEKARLLQGETYKSVNATARDPLSDDYDDDDDDAVDKFGGPSSGSVKHTTILVANGRLDSSISPPSRKAASLKKSLLSSGDDIGGSGAYIPSEIDIRTEEEEQKDAEILGYDPVEAEQTELAQGHSNGAIGAAVIDSNIEEPKGWVVMPAVLNPWRRHIAACVAILLIIVSFMVIGLNIADCVQGGC